MNKKHKKRHKKISRLLPLYAATAFLGVAFFYWYFYAAFSLIIKDFVPGFVVFFPDKKAAFVCADFRKLDGLCLAEPLYDEFAPLAVMIDNSIQARPIEGLEAASIVYESIVESGITRYLAIFDSAILAEHRIGPVRSTRPYYIDWAREWDAVLFHSGQSPQALIMLRDSLIKDVNEISGDGRYYFRESKRRMPHNLFITGQLMLKAARDKDFLQEADFQPWLFKDEPPEALLHQEQSVITIDFSVPAYQVTYQYDSSKNSYKRFLGSEDTGIFVKNVVIQRTKARVIDHEARLSVITAGRGDAKIYIDGQMLLGYWQTKNRRTRFYNSLGDEIEFNRGPIWIEVVFE